MTTIVPAAPGANLKFEHDLSSEVPNAAFIEGVRARWLSEVGIVELTTVAVGGVDIWEQENAATLHDAEQWVRFYDYSEWEGEQCR